MSDHPRCLYSDSIISFLNEPEISVFGQLCDHYHGEDNTNSREAWKEEVAIMRETLSQFDNKDGRIIFEYDIPRLGKRIDVVLLYKGIIFCIEFKVGESKYTEAYVDQVLDYALDLKNFHKLSTDHVIIPILVPTKYPRCSTVLQKSAYDDQVENPLITGVTYLPDLIKSVLMKYPDENPIDNNWIISPYAPTPTIIEAARSLYENHTVEDITRHEADQVFTDRTIAYILKVIHSSKEQQKKSICFVTGVPGAGKTLVGLDVAIRQTYQNAEKPGEDESAVYLSGNGPLVAVLTEALARDNLKKAREKKEKKEIIRFPTRSKKINSDDSPVS